MGMLTGAAQHKYDTYVSSSVFFSLYWGTDIIYNVKYFKEESLLN